MLAKFWEDINDDDSNLIECLAHVVKHIIINTFMPVGVSLSC